MANTLDALGQNMEDNQADPNTLMDRARSEYPILNSYDYGYKYSPGRAPFMLEHWEPGMTTSIPGVDRPSEFPNSKHGLEVFDPKTKPIDLLGDIVSHHMRNVDPVINQHYQDFSNSIEPWQQDILHEQYDHAKKSYGENQDFESWKSEAGLPAYFRGYPFQQWPKEATDEMYTQGQRDKLDSMMNYLRQPGNGQAGRPLSDIGN